MCCIKSFIIDFVFFGPVVLLHAKIRALKEKKSFYPTFKINKQIKQFISAVFSFFEEFVSFNFKILKIPNETNIDFFLNKGAASPQANISSSLDSLLMCLVVDCRFSLLHEISHWYSLAGSPPSF